MSKAVHQIKLHMVFSCKLISHFLGESSQNFQKPTWTDCVT